MNTVFTVTALFSLLLNFARTPAGLDLQRSVSKSEMQLALVAFEADGPGVTKQEAAAVRESVFKVRRSLTAEAQSVADLWLSQRSSAASGTSKALRRAEAFRLTSLWLRGIRGSQKLTQADAQLLLSILGTKPNPARVFEVADWLRATPLSTEGKNLVERWIGRSSSDDSDVALVKLLKPAVDGLLWMSESDYPIHPICFSKSTLWPFTKTQMAKQLSEPSSVPSSVRPIAQLFNWVSAALNDSDPVERARAERFKALRSLLEDNLRSVRAYTFGEIDKDLIVLGETKEKQICGIVTRVVET